jgi:NAD(P)-dependent dehydrogenase (short-subunit alcohol dehydrogenase family)
MTVAVRRALVTGGSRGIGAATALRLAEATTPCGLTTSGEAERLSVDSRHGMGEMVTCRAVSHLTSAG